MATEIRLPEVSENVDSGDIVKVLVKVGDKIEVDQPVIELETDKAMFEVPATEGGTVAEIKVKEGDKINIGDVILTVDANGAAPKEEKQEEKQEDKKEEEPKKEEVKEEKAKEEDKQEEVSEQETEPAAEEEPVEKEDVPESKQEAPAPKRDGILAPASPSVRRLARELGVDINEIQGSGTGGRISDEDVKKFVKGVMKQGGPTVTSHGGGIAHKPLPDFSKWGETETEKMSNVRRVTAEGLSYAWNTTPMVTQFDEADITELEVFRKKNGPAMKEKGGHLTVTGILVKISEVALAKFPQFNTSIDMEKREVIYKKYYNIGIAVDTDRGLLVPVIKDVNKKSLTDISVELGEISAKARDRKITPEEMDGGTFTISNLGGIGGTGFTPIVYSPQVAILGVSRASYKPVYKDGEFVPKFVMPLSLTYDHRIIDGADAARFLRWICEALDNPFNMML
jgi:pyruvate dehydrogenase E2 component (dihydrolipoamide acetyltransferase)